jgi:galactonate dehydratase
MKVTELVVRRVPVSRRGDWLFVQLRTDEGLVGIGEASQGGGDAETIRHLRQNVAPRVVGSDPRDMLATARKLYGLGQAQGRQAATAVSATEQALWDLAGQAHGVPVWQLLGGKLRPRIWVYANINRATGVAGVTGVPGGTDRSPESFAANAKRAVAAGFRAVKLASFDGMPPVDTPEMIAATEKGIACVFAVREAVGPDVQVLLDVHCHFNAAWAIRVARRLEPMGLFWYEDPVPRSDWEGLARVRREIEQPIAAGESFFGLEPFWRLFTQGTAGTAGPLIDIAMPDVKHCGGLAAMARIGALAEAAHVQIAPHNPSGPVAQAATVQACAALPTFTILEHAYGETDWRQTLVEPAEALSDGFHTVPDGPGLGVRLNEEALKEREKPMDA